MQWSCPHCGISLAVADDVLGTGWSFSRCYKCGGFALIRRAEINIIKVDKAPPGERIILPEASHDPAVALMSETATQKMAKHAQPTPPASPQSARSPIPPPMTQLSAVSNSASSAAHIPIDMNMGGLPEPLPEISEQITPSILKRLPIGIVVTGTLATISGFYLYIQGQTLWQRARDSVVHHSEETLSKPVLSSHISRDVTREEKREISPPPALLTNESPDEEKHIPTQVITDQVQRSAMAPVKPTPTQPKADTFLTVQILPKKANLHSGPGAQYPIVGAALSSGRYRVTDWRDRWFKLQTDLNDKPKELGWIRNDLIRIQNDAPHP